MPYGTLDAKLAKYQGKLATYTLPPTNFFEIDFYGTTIYNLRVGDASITSGGNPQWDMGDGSILTTINFNFNYTYSDPYEEPVEKTIRFSHDDFDLLRQISAYGSNTTTQINKISSVNLSNVAELDSLRIYNTTVLDLDLTSTKLGNIVFLYSNPWVTSIQLSTQENLKNVNEVRIYLCSSLNAPLDFSGFKKLGGSFQAYSNAKLSGITFPSECTGDNFTTFRVDSCATIETLDLTAFTKLGGNIRLNNMTKLREIEFPVETDSGANAISVFDISNCTSLGYLDLSGLSKIGGFISFRNNNRLTSVTFAPVVTGNNISSFWGYTCPFLEELNLSSLTKLGGTIDFYSNNRLRSVTFPAEIDSGAGNITRIQGYFCPSLGSLDMSSLTKMGGTLYLHANSTVTSYTFPSSVTGGNFTVFSIYNCPNLGPTLDVSALTKLGGEISMYTNASLENIIFPSTVDAGANNISAFYVNNNASLVGDAGVFDVSMFTKLGGGIRLDRNPKIINYLFPETISGNNISELSIFTCSSLGPSLDITPFTTLGGAIKIYDNPLMEEIVWPTDVSGNNISSLEVHSNPELDGVLDVSMLKKMGGLISVYNNPKLTGLVFASTLDSGVSPVDRFNVYSCSSLGPSLDLSMFTKAYTTVVSGFYAFNFHSNSSLTSVQWPVVENGARFCYSHQIVASLGAFDASTVDQLFLRLRDFYTTNTPIGNVSVNISGGTTSPPSVDGSTYISALQTIFTNASRTITITINT